MKQCHALQQQHSINKKWMTILEGTLDETEKEFHKLVNDPNNVKYQHKYRVVEMTHICSN